MYCRFRHPAISDDLFLNVAFVLFHTCISNAWLSSELEKFFHANLRRENKFRRKFWFSARPNCSRGQFLQLVGLGWSVEFSVEVRVVQPPFPFWSCEGTTFSETVWDSWVVRTFHSFQIWFLGFSKRLMSYMKFFGLGWRSKAKPYAANLRKSSISECLFVLTCWAQYLLVSK